MPPTVAAPAMNPKRRRAWSLVNTSTMKAQNTETTNRLKTDVQMKKIRPTQTFASPLVVLNRTRKTSRLSAKKR